MTFSNLPFYCYYCGKEFKSAIDKNNHSCESKTDLKDKLRKANHDTGCLFAASEV